jgi:hypothetical protein
MSENKNAKTPADDGQPDAWCNGMPAYEGPLSKEQRKPLVQDLDAPLTLNGVPLYTAPPKQWVGLTEEEIQNLGYLSEKFDASNSEWFDRWGFARAIEEKLKEKNT